jgi:endonuclease/exonuclease/phosphatase family metal-dependent hydrolase
MRAVVVNGPRSSAGIVGVGALLSLMALAASGHARADVPPSGTDVPVVQWNIEVDDSSAAHAQLAMDLLMATSPRPQIITIAEGWLEHFNDYINELEAQTGQTWYGAFATHCPPGAWNGTTCTATPTFPLLSDQGVGIFSTFPIVSTSSTFFPFADCWDSARGAVQAAINVNGTIVQVFATHLQTGGCADDAQSRYNSMAMLRTWASGFSTPQLVAGDFNADMNQIDTPQGMLGAFVDSWAVVGSGPGFTCATPDPTMKLDYWFADPSGTAQPLSSSVVTSTGMVSDHYPVAAMFQIASLTSNMATPVVRQPGVRTFVGDFDGDGKADLTVFRPSDGTWYVLRSGTNYTSATGMQWGNSLDIPVPGDYDGDGKADIAVFRPSNGTWYIVQSSTGTAVGVQWGNGLDVPVPGDYDGDGKTDLAVFRPSNGTWYLWYSSTGTPADFQWGNGNDLPVPGDYDGDGKTDIAVFRPSSGTWYLWYSRTGTTACFQWGNGLDVPVPGDYDGDGKTDLAVFRPSNGTWYLWYSGTGTTAGFQWGNGNDIP